MIRVSKLINRTLPLYFPKGRRFTGGLHIAVWNCGHSRNHNNLLRTIKDIRITVRKDYKPIMVIKHGAV